MPRIKSIDSIRDFAVVSIAIGLGATLTLIICSGSQNACEALQPETHPGSTPAIDKSNCKHVGMRSIAVPRL
jgi:hypothetical protein